MIEPTGVVHFSIPVSDLEVSRRFYTELLGLKFKFEAPAAGMVFLTAGEDHVILCKSETKIERSAAEMRRIHHAFKLDPDKYEDAKTFLKANGVDIFEEEDRKSGVFVGRQFYIRDPDGTVIEFSVWDGASKIK